MERTKSLEKNLALELFSSDAFLVINKKLLIHYGPDTAVFLSNLVDKYRYFEYKKMLKDEEWFYLTHEQVMAQTGLTETKIRTCKAKLRNDNIISTKMMELPIKEFYHFNWKTLIKIMMSDLRVIPQESLGLNIRIPEGYYNNTKINNIIPPEEAEEAILPNGFITKSQFDKFWKVYPRKVDKGKALTAWNRICTKKDDRPTWRQIKGSILQQIKSARWQDPKFIPHPTTWLNQSRWLDDAEEMKSYRREEQQECPFSFTFGKDYDRFEGCHKCEDKFERTYILCGGAYRKLPKDTKPERVYKDRD